jgi:hypothetical protein
MKRAVVWTFFWWQEGQNQRERLRMRYQRFDGVVRDYLLEP